MPRMDPATQYPGSNEWWYTCDEAGEHSHPPRDEEPPRGRSGLVQQAGRGRSGLPATGCAHRRTASTDVDSVQLHPCGNRLGGGSSNRLHADTLDRNGRSEHDHRRAVVNGTDRAGERLAVHHPHVRRGGNLKVMDRSDYRFFTIVQRIGDTASAIATYQSADETVKVEPHEGHHGGAGGTQADHLPREGRDQRPLLGDGPRPRAPRPVHGRNR